MEKQFVNKNAPVRTRSRHGPSEKLRRVLLELPPTGTGGFEGLIATALADLTGLTFRLAKSGSQFGKDASSPRGRFAVAMEAKRYADPLRLEEIAGKIWNAAHELSSDVDLWVLCATASVGDGDSSRLEAMLEERGITLLILDWTTAPLPLLGVLIATAKSAVGEWCCAHLGAADARRVKAAADAIVSDPAFGRACEELRRSASADHVGLAALAEFNGRWCRNAFSNRTVSRQAFGQYLTVCDSSKPAIVRSELTSRLDQALAVGDDKARCVAVLGPEGTGKSWLAAQWWATAADKPIFVIGGSNVADVFEPADPLLSLARLIARQSDGDRQQDVKKWAKRLRRWRDLSTNGAMAHSTFLVLLDGLNERTGKPWADIISGLAQELRRLGGRLIVTCRDGYWRREVAPRLADVEIEAIEVGGYSPDELNEILRQRSVDPSAVGAKVREFIRNPRICSIAIDLVADLSVKPDELTTERLMLEYWQFRLRERGDLVGHNINDFEKLLKSHAKALRQDPCVHFDRDDWREHSGAARRADGRSIENDLTDIEEGAFLRIASNRLDSYEFKPDVVPFALGLLIADELQEKLSRGQTDPAAIIDGMIEEVQGFDLTAGALCAAATIACVKEIFPRAGRAALLSAWLELQNVPDDDYQAIVANAATRPAAVLDTVEVAFANPSHARHREWPLQALLDKRDHPAVSSMLEPRIVRWLGLWSREPLRLGGDDEEERQRQSTERKCIGGRLASLLPAEQALMRKTCHEIAAPEGMQIDSVAILLMAGHPLASYAESVLAWSLVGSVTHSFHRDTESLRWVIRMNNRDFPEFECALRQAIDSLMREGVSDVGRVACAWALRLLGTINAAEEAARLDPPEPPYRWRLIENYCATDPYDPSSDRAQNLDNAINEATGINPADVSLHIGASDTDDKLEWITPGLSRFEHDAIVPLLRAIACSIAARRQLALRQLTWRLPRLSPLFDSTTLQVVDETYHAILRDPDRVAGGDRSHVAGTILLSLLPHFDASAQLERYVALPVEVQDWLEFRSLMKALTASEFEAAWREAEVNPIKQRRILVFAGAHRTPLNDFLRHQIGVALDDVDTLTAAFAFELAFAAEDTELDRRVVQVARQRNNVNDTAGVAFLRERAVAAAIGRLGQIADLDIVAPHFLSTLPSSLTSGAWTALLAALERPFTRLLQPIKTRAPQLGRLHLEVDTDGKSLAYFEEIVDDRKTDPIEALRQSSVDASDPRRWLDRDAARRKTVSAEVDRFLQDLSAEDARALCRSPDLHGLKQVVGLDVDQARAWAARILDETDQRSLSNIAPHALCLAEALAEADPQISAALYSHVAKLQGTVTIVRGVTRIPQAVAALFAGPDIEPLRSLRAEAIAQARSDAELETLVFAAQAAGYSPWLDQWTNAEAESGLPGRIARALMVEGLRDGLASPSALLTNDWGKGFLGEVATKALFAQQRNDWARRWTADAAAASDPVEFWRLSELAIGIADVRAYHWLVAYQPLGLMRRFGAAFYRELKKTAKKRTEKRAKVLFGLKPPDRDLFDLMLT